MQLTKPLNWAAKACTLWEIIYTDRGPSAGRLTEPSVIKVRAVQCQQPRSNCDICKCIKNVTAPPDSLPYSSAQHSQGYQTLDVFCWHLGLGLRPMHCLKVTRGKYALGDRFGLFSAKMVVPSLLKNLRVPSGILPICAAILPDNT